MKDRKLTENEKFAIMQKAKAKRYKKPIHETLNIDSIINDLSDIENAVYDVTWFFESGDQDLLEELIGGEDEAREFKFMFSSLSNDCQRMNEDLQEEYVPEMFDIFFVAIADKTEGGMLGFDDYVEDYMGISIGYETGLAINEAQKKVKRYTKDELIEGAARCFRIATSYIALKSRYEDLEASMDMIRNKNRAELEVLNHIDELYDMANNASDGFRYNSEEVMKYDSFISTIDPYSQMWIG